ncbi:MAG TPA: tRNA (adenosine(37)-N6)-threonylcarbamoyltransferase complex ATPase subunit type 1 TsaE [Terriglobales bacterium]|nr:tRNA (adenosine(37)-N6)-threonylcarbamoyltransferase complex ATPase subunit type 1 TsaE [Terriglobales bacterium]
MNTKKVYETASPEQTVALGRELIAQLRPPKIVLLSGNLGAGKTTLVKGIVEGFKAAAQEEVTSPTFTLIHEYRSPEADIYHIDLYRIDTQRELETLGIDDLIGPRSLIIIEWGEKFERFRKERDVEIVIERTGEEQRRIRIHSR